MNKAICSQEMAIAEAVRMGQWNESLEAHVAGCANCRELKHTVRAMQSLTLPPCSDSSLPEATRKEDGNDSQHDSDTDPDPDPDSTTP